MTGRGRPRRREPVYAEALLIDEWRTLGDLATVLECEPCGHRRTVIGELRRHRDTGILYGRVESPVRWSAGELERRSGAGITSRHLMLMVESIPADQLERAYCRVCQATRQVPHIENEAPPDVIRCPARLAT